MRSAVSIWWPIPVESRRWFSADELGRSVAYHRPMALAASLTLLGRILLLVVAAETMAVLARRSAAVTPVMADGATLGAFLAGVVATVLALRLPVIVVDVWFEYRHEPRVLGRRPSPPAGFVAVVALTTLTSMAALTAASYWFYWLTAATGRWPFVMIALAIVGVAVVAVAERPFRRRFSPTAIGGVIEDLSPVASRFGLPPVEVSVAEPGRHALTGGAHDGGPTAHSVGLGRRRRVVVSPALLEEPEPVRRFVIAHELGHLAARHALTQTMAGLGALVGFIAVLVWAMGDGGPWEWFGFAPTDPRSLPLVALVAVMVSVPADLALAWLGRSHERAADMAAAGAVELPDLDQMRRLFLGPGIDLEPSLWARWNSHHPAPAERLEFLHRLGGSSESGIN